ncbi:GNAT family N-acetyltransferase [Paenibacillus sp. 481]|uniref:GNAT family N-acetyltransferase n=1 Tax=Paenibacillus sp. 481 TaxID=2835869 RepID=UPI001E54BA99|nr:GNAT family N-acetyltransferase [Paenibacillus sp. 481]UHA74740.1 GNAT family N-acetyltransferase [Paenibacillus sp. 481]
MIKRLNLKDINTLKQLWALQQAAYRVEADKLGFDKIPPLMETEHQLASVQETFHGWWQDNQLVGAVSYVEVKAGVIDIYRLMVHPDYFRRKIGSTLLDFVLELPDIDTHYIATGVRNEPALELYKRKGFSIVEDQEIAPGVWLRHLERTTSKAHLL